jgi:hypothetical protein
MKYNFSDKTDISSQVNHLIDQALELEESLTEKRTYLGGSRLGVHCDRALQYEFTGHPVDLDKRFSGRILRIFSRGHWVESLVIECMKKAGLGIIEHNRDGKQFGFVSHGGYVKGHCDGIVISGPQYMGPWPRLWECKGLGAKYWRSLVKHRLKKDKPVYYAQCQYYMGKFNLTKNPALFCAVNMDTMELYWESVPFDPNIFELLEAKAWRIINACKAGELLPRDNQDPEFYKCKMCNWQIACHGKG